MLYYFRSKITKTSTIIELWHISGLSYTNSISNALLEDFDLNEDHTPDLAKGEILCRALFLSVDPITRLYMKYGMSYGETFPGRQVARIVESRNKDFSKGKVRILELKDPAL